MERTVARMAPCLLGVILAQVTGCGGREAGYIDRPRIASDVVVRDVVFHCKALGREMRYRVALPASVTAGRKLPVVYLLHGNGGDFRDWSNYSNVTQFVQSGLILVMPQGDDSYYVNAAERPAGRYEDYIVQDLLSDAELRFPIARNRANRGIVGVSMGGFGAIKLGLSHPDLFVFVGALSPAIDVARRKFSIKRFQQYRALRSIFGPWESDSRRLNDPFFIARSVEAATVPYIYLSCGDEEGLLGPNREFDALLTKGHVEHEFHVVSGGHNWNQWNREVKHVFECWLRRRGRA